MELASLMHEMIQFSFDSNKLPDSMTEANICVFLKKGKCPEECGSYRPISLLNVDTKILAKILAIRLESILPTIINPDQTGFVKGRSSAHNVRRLLNIIQYSNQHTNSGLVISLDAEKAFDRVEWPYLFSVLSKFNLGDVFIKWVRMFYSSPTARVITNGLKSPEFTLARGTRQGCPMSPLLFALAIEPLAAAIRDDPSIEGLRLEKKTYKISLYADDILIYLNSPQQSIPYLIDKISNFGSFSGYKINLLKSEAMPLSKSHSHEPTTSHPFKWSPTGFVYLGIKITPNLESLYKSNFAPIFKNIRSDLDRWCNLPLSLLGRVHLVKMNILPRLLYPFQMLPVLIPNKALKQLRGFIISFIWRKKRPRLRYNFLTLPSRCGGLAAPDIKLYQLSAHLRFILEWHLNDPNSTWISAEAVTLGPVPLRNLLYLSPKKPQILIKEFYS